MKYKNRDAWEDPSPRRKRFSAVSFLLLVLLIISVSGNIYMYSALNDAKSYADYLQSENDNESAQKEEILKKCQEGEDTLNFWAARGCVVPDGTNVYHEDVFCSGTDEDHLNIMSVQDAVKKGYIPCEKCAEEWKVIYYNKKENSAE